MYIFTIITFATYMDYNNKPKDYYNNIRMEMLEYLPEKCSTALDVGCGDGAFAKIVKERKNAETWGIEYQDSEAQKATQILDKVFSGPCEDHLDSLPDNFFDVIFFNDVLEHLIDPYMVLKKIKAKLKPEGIIVSSIPNIRYHNALLKLLFDKDWKYEEAGVMDHTHMRFFTKKSIARMYEEAGYSVLLMEGLNKSRSIRPYLFNIPFLFTQMDIRYPQYATVAKKNNR